MNPYSKPSFTMKEIEDWSLSEVPKAVQPPPLETVIADIRRHVSLALSHLSYLEGRLIGYKEGKEGSR